MQVAPHPTPPLTQAHSHSLCQIVEWAFGKRMTPAERLRKHQRALEKTQRELDRERVKLENQEKKLIQDIKKSAKNGQMGACKIQAKDLVRTRRYAVNIPSIFACLERIGRSSRASRKLIPSLSTQIHTKILRYAHPTTSHIPPHPDCAFKRTNDAKHERRNLPSRIHEPANEPPSSTTHSHGIRKGKRHYGSAAGDDG